MEVGSKVKHLVCHIGLFKTGTSYLQSHVFPSSSGGFEYCGNFKELETIIYGLNNASPFDIGTHASKFLSHNPPEKLFISREDFSGNPYINHQDFFLFARFIHLIADRVDFVLTIRRQDDYLESLYKHYVQTGGTKGIRAFLSMDSGYRRKSGRMVDWRIDFTRILETLQSDFPNSEVLILPYEELGTEENTFLNRFAEKFGIQFGAEGRVQNQVNASVSSQLIGMLRVANSVIRVGANDGGIVSEHLLSRVFSVSLRRKTNSERQSSKNWSVRRFFQTKLSPHFKKKIPLLDQATRNEIMKYHAPLNKQFDERFSAGLDRFGYY